MSTKTKTIVSSVLIIVGLLVLGLGVYDLGYHNGLEITRSDSGLGGFAEWASSWIEISIGVVTTCIGWLIRLKALQRN